ncbi:hypothetical protein BCEN4_520032 [Burkholderia cenocepacia]|nr:hypothetical protein BCEN4_520032 [Burkholderia cenocepacia]
MVLYCNHSFQRKRTPSSPYPGHGVATCTDEPTHHARRFPLRRRPPAGRDRRLVVAADRPRRVRRAAPLRRIPEESRPREEHPGRAPAQPGRARNHGRRAGRRRRRASRIRADRERPRAVSAAGRAAAVGRGFLLRTGRGARAAGRPEDRAAGQEAGAAFAGRPRARPRGHGRPAAARLMYLESMSITASATHAAAYGRGK